MKRASILSVSFVALSIALGGVAIAQSSHDQHHPDGGAKKSAQAKPMPMDKGMKPSEMPGGGMMGKGKAKKGMGMMSGGMMGKGMMQGGMMQMMGRNCPMMGMMMGEGDGATHADGRIAFLKAELAITDEQKGAFDAYAAALKKNLKSMHSMRQGMMAKMNGKTPPERLSAHLTAMEGRMAALKEVKPALDKLYDALKDEQKKKADKILTGMGCMM